MLIYNRIKITSLLIFSLLHCLPAMQGQTVKQLEAQRKKALQQIETTSKMLDETKKSQQSSVNKIVLINRNIKERQALITSINQEIGVLDAEMEKLNLEKLALQEQVARLKADYAELLRKSQTNQSFYSKLMFVMSGKTFAQTVRRLRYVEEYSTYRKQQTVKMQEITQKIQLKNDSLSLYKNRQLNVVRQKTVETDNLSKDKKKENQIVSVLTKKEKELQQEIVKQQKKANDLNAKIEKQIAQEIARAEAKRKSEAERKARQAARNAKAKPQSQSATKTDPKASTPKAADKSTPANVAVLTAEESLLAGSFAKNQGRLPWPTDKGFVRGHFGVQQHPVLSHIVTNNKGIYIQTPKGTNARAVFDGVVTQCFAVQGSNNAVIVQHGNYRTVYANLTDIYVKEGDKVKAKQNVGRIFTDEQNDNKSELYFQVWCDKSILNPEKWLAK
ncbi:MAG: peptidoglycan DD-metalloendopeptidase family protein [Prevotellaceae bacterium]|jgi:septal ring factor EnvC (AmiA/AmiB activator)|nr:peptidoglycan DD-metalloendopeptidase family protein [Prevotellaceae bacterium]